MEKQPDHERTFAYSETAGAPPDWSRITHEIPCPLCDYNLYGLDRPRCPECGYRFDWVEMLDPKRQQHPYLFEHHPECNIRSWRQTWAGAWRPRPFWSSLHPVQPSRPLRLLAYWFVGLVFIPVVMPALVLYPFRVTALCHSAVRSEAEASLRQHPHRRARIIAYYGSVTAYLDHDYPTPTTLALCKAYLPTLSHYRGYLGGELCTFVAPLLLLAWPWLTLVSLLIFQISIRRARIRTIHLARCVLYSFDVPSWALILFVGTVVLGATLGWTFLVYRPYSHWARLAFSTMLMLMAVWLCVGAWRLYRACALYLRFSWPAATVIASQVVTFLVLLVLIQWLIPELAYALYAGLGLVPGSSW